MHSGYVKERKFKMLFNTWMETSKHTSMPSTSRVVSHSSMEKTKHILTSRILGYAVPFPKGYSRWIENDRALHSFLPLLLFYLRFSWYSPRVRVQHCLISSFCSFTLPTFVFCIRHFSAHLWSTSLCTRCASVLESAEVLAELIETTSPKRAVRRLHSFVN
jgi:hypothetical protein